MAKAEMICPFSGKLCKECAIYRGRHYYLCFCKRYRGYVDKSGPVSKVSASISAGINYSGRFEIPSVNTRKALDPFAFPLRDVNEQTAGFVNEA